MSLILITRTSISVSTDFSTKKILRRVFLRQLSPFRPTVSAWLKIISCEN